MNDREQRMEAIIVALLRAEGIGFSRVPKMLSCGCDTCLALIAAYQEVAHIIDAPPAGAKMN